GIGVRHIQPGFYNCCGYQYIVFTVYKIQHNVFQLIAFQLPTCNSYFCFGNQFLYQSAKLAHIGYAVMDEENLSLAFQLKLYGFFYQFFVKYMKLGNYRLPVKWRCLDNR